MGERFRGAASESVLTGLKSIATGMIDGVFALLEPADDGASNGN
jgi:hypothetical protein